MGKLVLDTICLEQSRGIITYTPGIDDPSLLLYFDLGFLRIPQLPVSSSFCPMGGIYRGSAVSGDG